MLAEVRWSSLWLQHADLHSRGVSFPGLPCTPLLIHLSVLCCRSCLLQINQGIFGALGVINSFPSERVLTLRERASGM